MAVKVIVSRYHFTKPNLMSEKEYISYKQIFQVEPLYNLAPKSQFWNEFALIKYCLITFILGMGLTYIWDSLAFIPVIAFFVLIMGLVSGIAGSMLNYINMSSARKKYYDELRDIIKTSSTYEEYCSRFRTL
ncbi:hypothetical protein HUW51_00265 (plasmid) [Adhaeribacter swui]|uniref:Uncharacterized protein n=1 Tax=Adhaeribacter swui TaxID=2086471 RepID=A0A7G7G241_9BACT|nr:hypothetical protein [Adhaeribacter swui]QNF31225.1 hypothetical protein HUW51_00265 [Adhaeribacter swui]